MFNSEHRFWRGEQLTIKCAPFERSLKIDILKSTQVWDVLVKEKWLYITFHYFALKMSYFKGAMYHL